MQLRQNQEPVHAYQTVGHSHPPFAQFGYPVSYACAGALDLDYHSRLCLVRWLANPESFLFSFEISLSLFRSNVHDHMGSDRIRHPGLLPILAGKNCTRFVFGGEPEAGFKFLFHLKWGAVQQNILLQTPPLFPPFLSILPFWPLPSDTNPATFHPLLLTCRAADVCHCDTPRFGKSESGTPEVFCRQ